MKSTEIRKLTREDIFSFEALLHLFNIAFEEERALGSNAHLSTLLSDEHFIAMAAFSENKVIGGLTAYKLPMYYSDGSEIFLYDMAVHPDHQRKGIGKQLLDFLKEYCIQHGISVFFVLAHEEDEHALEFYRSTGGQREHVANFLYEIEPDNTRGIQ